MTRSNRRHFLKTTASAGLLTALSPRLLASGRIRGANARLNIGVIGVGGRGAGNLRAVAGENIVALADVDRNRLTSAASAHPEATLYVDYRELLEQDGLDAVVVSTPDHHHAPAGIRALRRGLHLYCEKPLTHTVREARALTETARRMKVATQMGTQNHESPGYRRCVELVRSGAIGRVHEVHVITDRPGSWWSQGQKTPTDTPPVPDHLEWDLWLGPALPRDYHGCYVPFHWRGWWDFGCGAIGDMAIHLMDPAFWALDLKGPVTVSTEGSKVLAASGPTWMKATFRFEAPDVTVHWYEGEAKPPAEVAAELPMNGSLFVGEKGRVAVVHGGDAVLLPEERFKDFVGPEPWLPPSPGHQLQWIEACKTGRPASSSFDYAGPFTEIVLLGNVSFRVGQTIRYDPVGMSLDVPEARPLLTKDYRSGWVV